MTIHYMNIVYVDVEEGVGIYATTPKRAPGVLVDGLSPSLLREGTVLFYVPIEVQPRGRFDTGLVYPLAKAAHRAIEKNQDLEKLITPLLTPDNTIAHFEIKPVVLVNYQEDAD